MKKFEMEIRSFDKEERTVEGIAVPYNQVIDVGGYRESFDRGAIEDVSDTKLFYNHEEPIGKIVRGEDSEDGFRIEAKISETPRGEEVLTLLRDGVLSKFSVGFMPVEQESRDGVTVRTKVHLREVSVVAFPAYSDADVLSVRTEEVENSKERNETKMEEINDNSSALADITNALETLERKVDSLEVPTLKRGTGSYFKSYGEYIKDYVARGERAEQLFRVYTGGTSDDAIVKDAWVGDVVKIIDKPRTVLNAYRTATLPSEGLNVEYGLLDTDTVDVDVQADEGDTLAYGAVSLTTATAPVVTYGGYIEMSRQEIERSSHVGILDTAFRAMAARYGSVTNAATRAAIVAATTQTDTFNIADLDDAALVMGLLVDSASALDDYNASLDHIICSVDVYKALVTAVGTDGRPMFSTVGASVNTVGSAQLSGLSGSLQGVPVIVDTGAAANTLWFSDREAVTTWESPGAPLRLSDGDITNLSNQYSVYGYAAVAVQQPNLIVKVTLS